MNARRNERGATMIEMAIAGSVVIAGIFGLIESGRLLWTHNALTDAARRGARYAAMHSEDANRVKNVVVYGIPNPPTGGDDDDDDDDDDDGGGGAKPVVNNLTTGNVTVAYENFGIKQGRVTVRITGYQFAFTVPLIGATMNLGEYKTTLTGEAAGYIPPTI
jgi:Flp pilus assembly pilin Flp